MARTVLSVAVLALALALAVVTQPGPGHAWLFNAPGLKVRSWTQGRTGERASEMES